MSTLTEKRGVPRPIAEDRIRRLFRLMRLGRVVARYGACFLALSSAARAQSVNRDSVIAKGARSRDSLVRMHSYPMSLTGRTLSGPGMDFLMRELAGVQFVALGERHGIREIPMFADALFSQLYERYGFHYLATENGTIATRLALTGPSRNNTDSIVAFAKRYPAAIAFNSDQDLELLGRAAVRLRKGKGEWIWGLDQEFGATYIFDRLRALGVPASARTLFDSLAAAAARAESRRFDKGGEHWLAVSAHSASFARLLTLYGAAASTESKSLLTGLESSARIYEYNMLAGQGALTGFHANNDREEMMKASFIRRYRAAVAGGEPTPKVFVKMGQAHLGRGQSAFSPFTVGNLLSEFALANGSRSFHLAALAHNDSTDSAAPSLWTWSAMRALAEVTPVHAITIVDLRPLRPYLHAGRLGSVEADWRRLIFGYDAVVLIGGARAATDTLTHTGTP